MAEEYDNNEQCFIGNEAQLIASGVSSDMIARARSRADGFAGKLTGEQGVVCYFLSKPRNVSLPGQIGD